MLIEKENDGAVNFTETTFLKFEKSFEHLLLYRVRNLFK